MTVPSPSLNPYATSEVTPTGPNSLARASFIIAIVIVVLAIIVQIVSGFLPMIMDSLALGSAEIGVFFGVLGLLNLVLGGLGLVLGLMGARRGDAALQAGIGIGIGGFAAITSLISLIVNPLASLLY